MAEGKKYTFTMSASVVDTDGNEMFDANVTYKNMGYDDVVLVEGAYLQCFVNLNEYAKNKIKA